MAFAGNMLKIRELLGKRGFDAVVVSMKNPAQTVELLNECAARSQAPMGFIRGNAKEKVSLTQGLSVPAMILPKEWDGDTLLANVKRAFRLKVWTAGEAMHKLMSRMEKLPSLPALYTQVMTELAKEDASTQFVGRLIAKDPAMTAKILQMVNSAAFSLASQIIDPGEAVMYLGAERTKSLMLLASLSLQFDKSACLGFSHEQLWMHSMTVGASAQAIAISQTKDMKMADLAYTAGLLHDVGKLLLAANVPKEYSQALAEAKRRNVAVFDAEMEVFSASHAELGAAVLGSWGLPVSILEAIAWHHRPGKSDDTAVSLLTVVHAADAVEREKVLAKTNTFAEQIEHCYIQRLGLNECCDKWRERCGFTPPSGPVCAQAA